MDATIATKGAADLDAPTLMDGPMMMAMASESSGGEIEIPKAKEILDTDHYDLQKVKDRILDFLSVRRLKPGMKGPILCFVGPPGVGKTSLGKSIGRR